MRIAHFADQHLGFRYGNRTAANHYNVREMDVAGAFSASVDQILAAKPDLVISAGDLFEQPRPTSAVILFAYQQFKRLRDAGIPVVAIAGNHETPHSADIGSPLRILAEIGVQVAIDATQHFVFPDFDLRVVAVPHPALMRGGVPACEGPERRRILVLHGDVDGVIPQAQRGSEKLSGVISTEDLSESWSFICLGHYHISHQVGPRAWYSGALEYVSSDVWGELKDDAKHGLCQKSWLLLDPDTGTAERQLLQLARKVYDLEPIEAADLDAKQVDALIAERLAAQDITGTVVRLKVLDASKGVRQALDFGQIRKAKGKALHFQLDVRAPDREVRVGTVDAAVRRRAPLSEVVAEFLGKRPLPAGMDQERFVAVGRNLFDSTERELVESVKKGAA